MARIGENVRPELGRADTKGILLGSMEGAAAIGQGLAAAGQSLAQGMQVGRDRKVKRKGAETKIEGLLKFYADVPELTEKLNPLLEMLRSDEVRASEKDAIIGQIDPLMDMFRDTSLRALQKEATEFQEGIVERQTTVAEGQLKVARKRARADMLTAKAQLRKGGVGPFNELGYRFGNDGTIQYQSVGFEAADKSGVEDLLARKDALATVNTDLQFLEDFRKTVEESTTGENVMGYLTSKLGDAAATKYAENFTSFSQDFAQRLAKARNGARVTDADVENAKKAIFNLAKSKTTNLQLIDKFTKELTDRRAEVERADEYLANNRVMIGYKGWQKGESLPGNDDPHAGQPGQGPGADLGRMRDEQQGIQRPLPPGGDDFAGMLRDANFSAADLEEWNKSNNAQKVAMLGKLRSRAGAAADVGGTLGVEDKLRAMEQALTPELDMKGAPTTQEIQEAERALSGEPQPPEQGLPAPRGNIGGQVPLPPESMRNIVREGQPAFNNPRLEGLAPEQIRRVEMGEPLTPQQEAHRQNEVEALEKKGGYEAIDLRDSQYQIPGGQTEVGMGDQRFLAKSVAQGRGLELTRIPDEIKENVRVLDVTRDVANSQGKLPPEIKTVVSLDSNAGKKGSRPQGIEMVLATSLKNQPKHPKVVGSKNYVKAVRDFFAKHGLDRKIRREGTEGILYKYSKSRMMYTEPFFLSDTKARKAIEENPREYAKILLNTLGKIPGVTFIPPHTSKDPGETSGGVNERDWAKKWIIPYLQELTAE